MATEYNINIKEKELYSLRMALSLDRDVLVGLRIEGYKFLSRFMDTEQTKMFSSTDEEFDKAIVLSKESLQWILHIAENNPSGISIRIEEKEGYKIQVYLDNYDASYIEKAVEGEKVPKILKTKDYASFVIKADDFLEDVKRMSEVASFVSLSINEDGKVRLECTGKDNPESTYSITLKATGAMGFKEKARYSISYLIDVLPSFGWKGIDVKFKTDNPIELSHKENRIWIAPRIESV